MGKKSKVVPIFLKKLAAHFDADPGDLPVIERVFPRYERPNLHQAIEDVAAGGGELLGIVARNDYGTTSLSKLARPGSASEFDLGPVEHVDETLPGDRRIACVKRGLRLFRRRGKPVALLLDEERYTASPGLRLEVMASDREAAEDFIRLVEKETRVGKAFRGGVLSLEGDCYRGVAIKFHQLPQKLSEKPSFCGF
jgi:cell division protease FtsH